MLLLILLLVNIPLVILACYYDIFYVALICNIAVLIIYFIPTLKIYLISHPLYKLSKNLIPKISETEKEALYAGDTWLGQEALKGKPDWNKIRAVELPKLSQHEQNFIDTVVADLCTISSDWEINTQTECIPQEVIDFIKRNKLWGLIIPKSYGGLDLSPFAQSCIVSKLATKSINVAITVMVPNSLGPSELLIKYGTEKQKSHYLPKLATGEEIPCFGLTSIVAGSDATSMIDAGYVCRGEHNGENIIGIRLSWNKRYITMAPIATLSSIAFKLYDPDGLLSSKEDLGITLCMMPSSHKGVNIGEKHAPMGFHFPNGTISGKDVFIPLDWLIGGEDYIGKGWSMLMECLAIGRSLSLPALASGTAQKCLLTLTSYTMVREQFNVPIAQFEGVEESLARVAGFTYIIEAAKEITISALDVDVKPAVESAIVKYHLTELGRNVITDSMDIFAGKGIQYGENNFVGYAYQATPISITVEGANILTRNLIIFGQGIMRFHPYIIDEVACFEKNTTENIVSFEKLVSKHICRGFGLVARNVLYQFGKIFNVVTPNSQQTTIRKINFYSNSLSLLSEFVLVYFGKGFKRNEKVNAVMGDILSYIYLSFSVIKYYESDLHKGKDVHLYNWCIQYLDQNIRLAFDKLFILIPNQLISTLLKNMFFPFGIDVRPHYFKLNSQVVKSVTNNDGLRESLTSLCHRDAKDTRAIDILEEAFKLTPEIREITKTLRKNGIYKSMFRTFDQFTELNMADKLKNILTKDEIMTLVNYTKLRDEAMQVDAKASSN